LRKVVTSEMLLHWKSGLKSGFSASQLVGDP